MQINLIAALSLNSVIGNRNTNDLPWPKDKYPEDMAHFRKMTAGEKSVVIMGNATMKSIGRKLPKRRNIVISRNKDLYKVEETGIETYSSVEEALTHCTEDETVWIIGGGLIYQASIHLAKTLYLTIIPEIIKSNDLNELVYFPFLNQQEYVFKEMFALNQSKQLFCEVYDRDTWLEEPLTKEELKLIENPTL